MNCASKLNSEQQAKANGIGFLDTEIANPPAEIFSNTRILSESNDEAIKLALPRGQHKIKALISYSGEAKTFDNVEKKIDIQGEFKRIYFHKIDVRPVAEDKAMLTLVFHILDNPIPIVPIVWAGSIVASAVAGYFFIDKVETFTNTIGGKISIALAVVTGAYLIFK